MSILIKGMEMPYGCADCDFCGGIIMPDGIYCCDCPTEASHGKNISDAINNDARADFCPLAEVKAPHGRLIDADEPMTKISTMMQEPDYQHEGEDWMVGLIMARDAIDDAPTVIEAEGSE